MKKLISMLLLVALALSAFAGCGQTTPPMPVETPAQAPQEEALPTEMPAERAAVRVAGLTGPTTMGLVKLMADAENGATANDYEFTVAGSADEVTPKLIQGELDMAAIPANLASVLYNNTNGQIRLLAINTLGVLYIVEKGETVSTVADLAGKTIYATGKGSIPEYTLRYILSQNGIDPDKDVTIEWKSEPTEVVALLSEAESGVAMLPQPYVTVAQGAVEGLSVALDLTAEWKALGDGTAPVTGVLVARSEFIEAHPEAVAAMLEEYFASAEYAKANPAEAAQLIEKYGIVKAAVAEKALPFCNIGVITGANMKQLMQGYLKVLFDANAKSVGGALPADDFYYEG